MASLVDALRKRLRMLKEDALAVAHTVDEAFHGEEELSDDHLDKDLRQLFYDLQDEKILDVRREEYMAENGRLLRGYFWRLRDDAADVPTPPMPEQPEEALVYLRMREHQWDRRPPMV